MWNRTLRTCWAVAVGVVVLATVRGPLGAHEKGVLKLLNRELVAGDSVGLTGEKFSRRGTVALLLSGVRGQTRLGDVRADAAGAFATFIRVPADLPPGSYRLIAVAPDGDEVAALEVSVVAHGASHGPATRHDEGDGPSAVPLDLARARSPWVTRSTVALIALALLGSGVLLRRSKVTH